MTDSGGQRLQTVFREHPALLVSALYVAASAIGMFYSWAYFRRFGINVFNYAQISDFLLVSLKEPLTWALVALAVLVVLGDNASSRRVQRKRSRRWYRWYASPRYRQVNYFITVFMVLTFIYIFANAQADDTKAGDGKTVEVAFAETDELHVAILLGTTGQFVFLYNAETERVDIHPIESIHSISFQAD